jgi:hypothetical protein
MLAACCSSCYGTRTVPNANRDSGTGLPDAIPSDVRISSQTGTNTDGPASADASRDGISSNPNEVPVLIADARDGTADQVASTPDEGPDEGHSEIGLGPGSVRWSLNYALSKLVGPKKWTNLRGTVAVDSHDRVFVTDGSSIFVVEAGVPSVYCTVNDISLAAGPAVDGAVYVRELRTDAQDKLYAIVDLTKNPYDSFLLVATAPGTINLSYSFIAMVAHPPHMLVVYGDDEFLFVSESIIHLGNDAMTVLYQPPSSRWEINNCGSMAAELDGFFYFIPDCTAAPAILGGQPDGTGLNPLISTGDVSNPWGLVGIASHPAGGAVLRLNANLQRVDRQGNHQALNLSPTMSTMDFTNPVIAGCGFSQAGIAVGPTETIYMTCLENVYQAVPIP